MITWAPGSRPLSTSQLVPTCGPSVTVVHVGLAVGACDVNLLQALELLHGDLRNRAARHGEFRFQP